MRSSGKLAKASGAAGWCCPPGEQHWHGATATTGMSHIATQEALGGKVDEWLDKVSHKEYLAAPSAGYTLPR